ncbi:MAG: serine hydrolase domain-containing protein, partial [Pseudomonadota bacterium]
MAMLTFLRAAALAVSVSALLSACSSESGGSVQITTGAPPPPPPPSPPPQSEAMDFSAVEAEIDAFVVANIAVMVGDENGVIFSHEKGAFAVDERVPLGSATKMVTGLLIWDLVDAGVLTTEDNPQDHIGFWTDIAGDGRSEVELGQLLAFTSGFSATPQNPGCIGDGAVSLAACVQDIYMDGLDDTPGEALYYGPEHMQIAALMAQEAAGEGIIDLYSSRLFDRFGLSTNTSFSVLAGDNPRYAGGLRSTAQDFGLLLQAVLAGDLVQDRDGFLADRHSDAFVAFRPDAVELNGFDWRYGFGYWKECADQQFTQACQGDPVISSAGAFGFTPWIDFDAGYWGVIAMNEADAFGRGFESGAERLVHGDDTPIPGV